MFSGASTAAGGGDAQCVSRWSSDEKDVPSMSLLSQVNGDDSAILAAQPVYLRQETPS